MMDVSAHSRSECAQGGNLDTTCFTVRPELKEEETCRLMVECRVWQQLWFGSVHLVATLLGTPVQSDTTFLPQSLLYDSCSVLSFIQILIQVYVLALRLCYIHRSFSCSVSLCV